MESAPTFLIGICVFDGTGNPSPTVNFVRYPKLRITHYELRIEISGGKDGFL